MPNRTFREKLTVTIIGTGYVGLTTGATLAFLGHQVTCVDIDENKLALLESGRAPFFEPHIEALMAAAGQNLGYSSNLAEAIASSDISFITVGTPAKADGSADLSAVAQVARLIGQALKPEQRHVVVNKSTVPIGAGNYVESLVREGYRAAHANETLNGHVYVASNPEFLREGSAVHDSLYPDRIVLGADDTEAINRLRELYAPILEQTFTAPNFAPRPSVVEAVPLVTTDLTSAETIKYAANAFLATKISFINEISGLCERVGADVSEVARGMGLDSRIGHRFLQAGVGWGGSCFGKDTKALIHSGKEYNYSMPILEAAICVNVRQRFTVIEKLQQELRVIKGRTVGLLGLAFKPHTDDLRDAPALDLIRELYARGCHLRVHDPVALPACRRLYPDLPVTYAETPEALAEDADVLVLVTDWPEYRDLDWAVLAQKMHHPLLIDGRNFLNPKLLQSHGFTYRGTGK